MIVFRGESRSMLRHLKRAVETSGRAAEEGSVGGRSKSLGKCHAADSKIIHLHEKEIVMKNTVKKILALVFAVVMVCSLAVPALAAEETTPVKVTVVGYNGETYSATVNVKNSKLNIEEAIKAFNEKAASAYDVTIASTTGLVTKVGGQKASEVDADNAFGTGYWAVALKGKLVSEDLGTVAVAKNNSIVVYWNDPTFDTKLVQIDTSKMAQGITSFYFYNAEGEKVALSDEYGTKVTLNNGATDLINGTEYFVADEKGQIWLAPSQLDAKEAYKVTKVEIDALEPVEKGDDYTKAEADYYNTRLDKNIITVDVINADVKAVDYNTADATGDMTMVYVLVAAAAMVTLAAVVVMKKKAVKAN